MRVLFIFLDGVGLGNDDPLTNPFSTAEMPTLSRLLGSRLMIQHRSPIHQQTASLVPLDACLGVPGLPQSASGQASLLTGKNIPSLLNMHYGPKPNPFIAAQLAEENLFSILRKKGKTAALVNAFPQRYFDGIQRGKHLPGAIAMAARFAGLRLRDQADLFNGSALSADFTGLGWRESLGVQDAPAYTHFEAGQRLSALAQSLDLAVFEYWLSDYAGHKQEMAKAVQILEGLDQVLAGLLSSWNTQDDLILVTSDHGNLEDLSTRRHTSNSVPAILIGSETSREKFANNLFDLPGITPAIIATLT